VLESLGVGGEGNIHRHDVLQVEKHTIPPSAQSVARRKVWSYWTAQLCWILPDVARPGADVCGRHGRS
jgi:hypothetical protein